MTMWYIPKVYCLTCKKPAEKTMRVFDPRTNERYIDVKCHGNECRIGFVQEPGQTVEVFDVSSKGTT